MVKQVYFSDTKMSLISTISAYLLRKVMRSDHTIKELKKLLQKMNKISHNPIYGIEFGLLWINSK